MPKVTKKKASPLLDEDKDTGSVSAPENSSAERSADEGSSERVGASVAPAPTSKNDGKIDKEMRSDKEHARLALAKEEQVHFMIPLAQGEKTGAFEEMWTNGFYTKIPKGVMSILPKSLAERLAEKYRVEAEAGAEFRLDLDPNKADNLTK